MLNKRYLGLVLIISVLAIGITFGINTIVNASQKSLQTESFSLSPISSTIAADGVIHSQNEATLNFQIGGKLTYLPFKEGDTVSQGQTIASIDQRALQQNIQSAVDQYKNQKLTFDTVNDFNGDRALSDTGLSIAARRQLEAAVNSLDQTQIALNIQQIVSEQSILTAPITGIVMHEDVTVPYVNITPATTFTLADPTALVFRANVPENTIDFVSLGAEAQIKLTGLQGQTYQGTVVKIYPQKISLASGQQVYQVDIQSTSMGENGKLQQSGTVFITNTSGQGVMVVPTWTVLQHKYIWVVEGNKPVVKQVVVGKTHGDVVEILSGLSSTDKVITNPQSIAAGRNQIL